MGKTKAKGRKSPQPGAGKPILTEAEDTSLVFDTDGIYWRLKRVGEDGQAVPVGRDPFDGETTVNVVDHLHNFDRLLTLWRDRAANTARQHLVELPADLVAKCTRVRRLDLGDGLKDYAIPKLLADAACTALWVVTLVDCVRESVVNGVPALALLDAFNLGRFTETLYVLPHERDAKRGKIVKRGAAAGGIARRSLDATEAAAAKAERDQLIASGLTETDACRVVAEPLGVSYKTITVRRLG